MAKQASGIYGIRSISHPERVYIGSAVNIPRRWRQHLSKLGLKEHHNPKLQAHYDKYGLRDLIFEFIISCEKDLLIKTEQAFIDLYNPWFNISRVAGNSLGIKRSAKTRAILSELARGNKNMLGKRLSEEAKKKISEAHKGRMLGSANPFYGKQHPKEIQERINSANRGRVPWNKGKVGISEETRKKLSEANKGKRHSEETRQKMREAHKKRRTSGGTNTTIE